MRRYLGSKMCSGIVTPGKRTSGSGKIGRLVADTILR
jgi:hypothetical protein